MRPLVKSPAIELPPLSMLVGGMTEALAVAVSTGLFAAFLGGGLAILL